MNARALAGRLVDLCLLLFVLLARALRPVVLIRFGPIRSDRIGHFTVNTEVYLCERDAGMHGKRVVDFFYCNSPVNNRHVVCNEQLLAMWARKLLIYPLVRRLDLINRSRPGWEPHWVPWPSVEDRDCHGLMDRTPPHLSFLPGEEERGRNWLASVGVPPTAPFVCFLSRDQAYLKSLFPGFDGSYHEHRNSRIESFLPALDELTGRGYTAFRMGAVVEQPLQTSNPRVIDYAARHRSEFLDLYLGAHCRFYLGDSCGFHGIPMIFRRPLALVNFTGLEYAVTWGHQNLFIPKKLWSRKDRRLLKFSEILITGLGRVHRSEDFEKHHLELIDSTPDEIKALATEMDERLKGTWCTVGDDEDLQRRFWSFYSPSDINGVFESRIGAAFLRENRALLD